MCFLDEVIRQALGNVSPAGNSSLVEAGVGHRSLGGSLISQDGAIKETGQGVSGPLGGGGGAGCVWPGVLQQCVHWWP